MHEYGILPRQYFHNLTPGQIEQLAKSIAKRTLKEQRSWLYAQHVGDPKKAIEDIDRQIAALNPIPEYISRPFSEEEISNFNIHIIENPNPA